jgi:cytochrome P450
MVPQSTVPFSVPFAGHLPAFLWNRLGFLERCAATQLSVVPLRIGGPAVLLREPEDIRYVLEQEPLRFEKSPRLVSERGRRLSGGGILTSSGERHRVLREAVYPLLALPALPGFHSAILETIDACTADWRTESVRDLALEIPRLAERILGRILFGADYSGQDRVLAWAFRVRKRYLQYRFDMPAFWPEWLPLPLEFHYRRAMAEIHSQLDQRLQRCGAPECLLDRLASAPLTDAEVRDEAITLAITGYETLADALTWAFWLLAVHPEVQTKAREDRSGPYIASVLSEAMRLYPPTWLFVRCCRGEEQLPSGHRLAPGTKIYLSPWVVHHDPRFYPEPFAFRPERFTAGEIAARPKLSYFPFGAGPRLCVGLHLAKAEGALVIGSLVRRFRFAPAQGSPSRPSARMTLRPASPLRAIVGPIAPLPRGPD